MVAEPARDLGANRMSNFGKGFGPAPPPGLRKNRSRSLEDGQGNARRRFSEPMPPPGKGNYGMQSDGQPMGANFSMGANFNVSPPGVNANANPPAGDANGAIGNWDDWVEQNQAAARCSLEDRLFK